MFYSGQSHVASVVWWTASGLGGPEPPSRLLDRWRWANASHGATRGSAHHRVGPQPTRRTVHRRAGRLDRGVTTVTPAAARSLRAVADPTGTTPDHPADAGGAAGVTAVPEAADTTPETETETAAAEEADAGPAVVVAPPGSAAGMELVFVDPATLVVAANVRGELDLDAEFLASVRDLGVLSPIKARRAADGGLRVLFGHRRAVAAAEVGRPVVPVVVVDAPDDAKAAEILRVVEQVVENTRRSGISEAGLSRIASGASFGVVEDGRAVGIVVSGRRGARGTRSCPSRV